MPHKNCLHCNSEMPIISKRDILRKKYCSYSCRQKYRWANEASYKKMFFERAIPKCNTPESNSKKINRLEKNGRYKKDRTLVKGRLRPESNAFKSAVLERDNFCCVCCGISGVKLIADHIKPFALYKELRYSPENGRAMCEPCHRKTDTYGAKTRTTKKENNSCRFVQRASAENSTS